MGGQIYPYVPNHETHHRSRAFLNGKFPAVLAAIEVLLAGLVPMACAALLAGAFIGATAGMRGVFPWKLILRFGMSAAVPVLVTTLLAMFAIVVLERKGSPSLRSVVLIGVGCALLASYSLYGAALVPLLLTTAMGAWIGMRYWSKKDAILTKHRQIVAMGDSAGL